MPARTKKQERFIEMAAQHPETQFRLWLFKYLKRKGVKKPYHTALKIIKKWRSFL